MNIDVDWWVISSFSDVLIIFSITPMFPSKIFLRFLHFRADAWFFIFFISFRCARHARLSCWCAVIISFFSRFLIIDYFIIEGQMPAPCISFDFSVRWIFTPFSMWSCIAFDYLFWYFQAIFVVSIISMMIFDWCRTASPISLSMYFLFDLPPAVVAAIIMCEVCKISIFYCKDDDDFQPIIFASRGGNFSMLILRCRRFLSSIAISLFFDISDFLRCASFQLLRRGEAPITSFLRCGRLMPSLLRFSSFSLLMRWLFHFFRWFSLRFLRWYAMKIFFMISLIGFHWWGHFSFCHLFSPEYFRMRRQHFFRNIRASWMPPLISLIDFRARPSM